MMTDDRYENKNKNRNKKSTNLFSWKQKIVGGLTAVGVVFGGGLLAFGAYRFKVCKPEQVLIRTGLGIPIMSIGRKGMQWPFQQATMVNMNPRTHKFNLHNMSKGKVEFSLPVVFTVAPYHPDDNYDAFCQYAKFMNNVGEPEIYKTIGGVIEGEMRGLTAGLSVEEMFSGKEKFNTQVVDQIQRDLDKLGIRIVNANIKEMEDYDEDNKYFVYRKQRAIQTANYDAQIAVAEAKKKGEIGVQQNTRDNRIAQAQLQKDAIIKENDREEEIAISNAKLAKVKAESQRISEIANIEAEVAAKQRSVELERVLYEKKKAQEEERMRSEELAKAKVNAESIVARAEGQATSMKLLAEASLIQEQKRAAGILAVYQSQAEGLNKIYKSCGNNPLLTQFYLALEKDLYPELAKQNAAAVQGMNPKIHVWNTGNSTKDPMKPIIDAVQSMSPLLQGIQDQGNIEMPKWIPHPKKEDNEAEYYPGNCSQH